MNQKIKTLIIDDQLATIGPVLYYLEEMDGKKDFDTFYSKKHNYEEIIEDILENLTWEPDVILLDLMLGRNQGGELKDLGGVRFLEALRMGDFDSKFPKHTPVVVLTAYPGIINFAHQYDSEINQVLSKPCSLLKLVDVLKETSEAKRF